MSTVGHRHHHSKQQQVNDPAVSGRDPHMAARSQRLHDTQNEAAQLIADTLAQSAESLQAALPTSIVEKDTHHLHHSQVVEQGVVAPSPAARRTTPQITRAEALEELERRRAGSPKRPPEDNRASLTSWAHQGVNKASEPHDASNYRSSRDEDSHGIRRRGVHERVREDYVLEAESLQHQNSLREHFYSPDAATKKWNHSDWYEKGEESPARRAAPVGKPATSPEGVIDPHRQPRSPIQRHDGGGNRRPTIGTPRNEAAAGGSTAIKVTPRTYQQEVVGSSSPSSYHADRYNAHSPSRGAVSTALPSQSRMTTTSAKKQQQQHAQPLPSSTSADIIISSRDHHHQASSPLDSIMKERGLTTHDCQCCQLLRTEVNSLHRTVRDLQNQMAQLVHAQRITTGSSPIAGMMNDDSPLREFPDSDRLLSEGYQQRNRATATTRARQKQQQRHESSPSSRRRRQGGGEGESDSEFSTSDVKDESLRHYIDELNKAKKLRKESRGLMNGLDDEGLDDEEQDYEDAALVKSATASGRVDSRVSNSRDAVLRREMQSFEKRLLKAMVQLANRVSTLEGDSLRLIDDAGQIKKDQSALFDAVVLKAELKKNILQVMETTKRASDEDVKNLYDLFHLQPTTVQSAVSSRSSQQCLDVVLNSPAFKGLFDMSLKSARQIAEIREQVELIEAGRAAKSSALAPQQQFLGLDLREENDLQGLKVHDVMIGSPAQAAGFVAGDRINKVNNMPVMTLRDYITSMQNVLPNTHVRIQKVPHGKNQFPEVVEVLATNASFMTFGGLNNPTVSSRGGGGGAGGGSSTLSRYAEVFGSPERQAPTGVVPPSTSPIAEAAAANAGRTNNSSSNHHRAASPVASGFSTTGFDFDGGSVIPLPPPRH